MTKKGEVYSQRYFQNDLEDFGRFENEGAAESGKSYFWCSCGQSSKQPFCDGSHEGTDFLPQKVKLEDEKDIFFCGCKMSKNGAFCDGTHKDL